METIVDFKGELKKVEIYCLENNEHWITDSLFDEVIIFTLMPRSVILTTSAEMEHLKKYIKQD